VNSLLGFGTTLVKQAQPHFLAPLHKSVLRAVVLHYLESRHFLAISR